MNRHYHNVLRRRGICACLAFFILQAHQSVFGFEYSLQQIRDAVTGEYTSIRSLDVKYSFAFSTNDPNVAASYRNEIEWCIDGSKSATFSGPPGDGVSWSIQTFDGEWSQLGSLTPVAPRQVKSLKRYRGAHPENLRPPIYASSFGFAFLNCEGNLVTLLEDPDAALHGIEPVDGHECVRVESGKVLSRAGGAVFRYSIWLDPKLGWLPRRLVCRFDPDTSNYDLVTAHGKNAVCDDFRLVEFGRFPDALLGRDRLLPTKLAAISQAGSFSYQVTTLTVNTPIAKERFTVAPTFGTEIIEGDHQNDPRARRWLHGGKVGPRPQKFPPRGRTVQPPCVAMAPSQVRAVGDHPGAMIEHEFTIQTIEKREAEPWIQAIDTRDSSVKCVIAEPPSDETDLGDLVRRTYRIRVQGELRGKKPTIAELKVITATPATRPVKPIWVNLVYEPAVHAMPSLLIVRAISADAVIQREIQIMAEESAEWTCNLASVDLPPGISIVKLPQDEDSRVRRFRASIDHRFINALGKSTDNRIRLRFSTGIDSQPEVEVPVVLAR